MRQLCYNTIVQCFLFQVWIGAYLEFTVGTLRYTGSTQATQPENVIIGATVGGVAVAVLLTIVIVVTVALLLIYGNRAAKIPKKYM